MDSLMMTVSVDATPQTLDGKMALECTRDESWKWHHAGRCVATREEREHLLQKLRERAEQTDSRCH